MDLDLGPELWRIRSTGPPLDQDVPVVTVRLVASNLAGVMAHVKEVMESTVAGLAADRSPVDPRWEQDLPGWFVGSFPREGFGSLAEWLTAMTEGNRAWRWWWADGGEVLVLVEGASYNLDALVALMTSAGADQVAAPERWTHPATLPWSLRPRCSVWDAPGVARSARPWMPVPQRRLFDRVAHSRLLWSFVVLPFFAPGVLLHWAIQGWPGDLVEPSMVPMLVVLSVVAVAETVFVVRWLRRPVERD